MAFINLDHPDLIRPEIAKKRAEEEFKNEIEAKKVGESINRSLWSKIIGNKAPEYANESDTVEMLFTKQVVISYFNTIKKNFTDSTIKAIMTFLVKRSKELLQKELISRLYNEEKFRDILVENPEIAQKRTNLLLRLSNLRKASMVLEGLKEFL